ncbi:Nn.00g042890.m01.CDS01 [Neocucurbitaria sp. VM-36]
MIDSTLLILARDRNATSAGTTVLQGYGIPYVVVDLSIPAGGYPQLNATPDTGNFGGIVLVSTRQHRTGDDWKQAMSQRQWEDIYGYQEAFGVRMVRLNAWPYAEFGVQSSGGLVTTDQPVAITNTTDVPKANLVANAQLSTVNLSKYPAKITNSSGVWEIAQFGTSAKTTAAVINKFPSGREQQVWFLAFDAESNVSTLLAHAWIHWVTRSLYLGFRRIYLNTQVDDIFLPSTIYDASASVRIQRADFEEHVAWMNEVNSRLPPGSSYVIELAHNGNGNIAEAVEADFLNSVATCNPQEAVYYTAPPTPDSEFIKPLGTGIDLWPARHTTYRWSFACSSLDPLEEYFVEKVNMHAFYHVSHTFTHEDQTNATYTDVFREITFNQEWFRRIGFMDSVSLPYFSPSGLVPPGITGLHNGDALRAWVENGIIYAVGDNTRPALMNVASRKSDFHPIATNVRENGYEGVWIIPRFSSSIYFNCDDTGCDNAEWGAITGNTGNFSVQLENEKITNAKNLLGLRWDPYMFHQANLRVSDTPEITLLGKNKQWSLLMAWTEAVLYEVIRVVEWPVITLKHDDLAKAFIARKTRDECQPMLTYNLSNDRKSITGFTVNAKDSNCGTSIPVTVPGDVTSATSATKEQEGADPITLWVSLGGSSKAYSLSLSIIL